MCEQMFQTMIDSNCNSHFDLRKKRKKEKKKKIGIKQWSWVQADLNAIWMANDENAIPSITFGRSDIF